MYSTHESSDAVVDAQHASYGGEARQLADDLGGQALHLLVGVLQQVDEAADAAELLQRHADALARAHLTQDLQRTHLSRTQPAHARSTLSSRIFQLYILTLFINPQSQLVYAIMTRYCLQMIALLNFVTISRFTLCTVCNGCGLSAV